MTPPDVSSSQLKRARDSQAGDNRVDEFDLLAVAAALVEVSPGLDLGDEEHLHQRALVAGRHVLAKGGPRVKHPTEYIVRSIRRDVDGWSAFAYRGELP